MKDSIALPAYDPEQVGLYQGEHLLNHAVCRFAPAQAAAHLQTDQEVMAIDIGGDKIRRVTYAIRDGEFQRRDEQTLQSRGGAGYLQFLERLAAEALARDLRVGISSATRLEGSVITRTVNLPHFFEEFGHAYGADYENLFPGRSFVANDTISGICGAATLLALRGQATDDVGFVICGSGLGASVIKDKTASHVEVAHVPLVNSLNPLGQTMQCNVEGKDYVCLERVTAARSGIETLYLRETGEARDGITLGAMYEEGDDLATLLYETSALALTHAAVGMMERYAFPDSERSVVVFHGGNFEIARYRDQVRRNLDAMPHSRSRIIFSRDLSANVCLDGAAIMAVHFGS